MSEVIETSAATTERTPGSKPLKQLALAISSVATLLLGAAGCKTTHPAKPEGKIFGHTSADQIVGPEIDRVEDCTDECVQDRKKSGASPADVYLECNRKCNKEILGK